MSETNGVIKQTEETKFLTREQLQTNVNVSKAWLEAVRCGNYPGSEVQAIAGLLTFLIHQHQLSLDEYEKESFKHPEWGNNDQNKKDKVLNAPVVIQ